ncbi:MAG TPA: polysaccharide deacetylase family protein [Acidimicrobiales bacterium]|nr:polysaccharide deacetylase family protein [Acidimicrobiales bacterium]
MEYARPVLEAQGVAANLNVIVQCLEDGLPPWTSRITDYLSASPASTRASLSLPGIEPVVVRSPKALSRTLKNRPRAERAPLWDSFQEQLRDIPVCWTPMMSRAEVIDAATKHEIGCHSSSHDSMGCESMQFFVADLETCEEYFEKDLRLPLEIYAFPNGSYRPQHLEFLAGTDRIKSILIVEERRSRAGATIHPRITFNAWTSHEARLRALGARTAG